MPGSVRIYCHPVPEHSVSVRGTVVKHDTKVNGRWFWKTIIPAALIRISDDQYPPLVAKIKEACGDGITIPQEIEICFGEGAARETFPVGAEVGLTFGYNGPWKSFTTGASPVELLGAFPNPNELPEEIVPVQLPLPALM
jgi:hypothetical protein